MHDIKLLEEEWFRYQKKKRKPWYIFFFVLFLLSVVMFFFVNNNEIHTNFFSKYISKMGKKVKSPFTDNGVEVKLVLINEPLKRLEIKRSTNKQPSSEIDTNIVNSEASDLLVDIPILEEKNDQEISSEDQENQKKVHLDIIETTSVSAYEDVEKRFYQSHDIDDALFLAKSYYKKGNYKKSEKWAFEANKLDENLEESFLIFVKSKIKLGHKNEARTLLEGYLKTNDSKDVRVLLHQIIENKI